VGRAAARVPDGRRWRGRVCVEGRPGGSFGGGGGLLGAEEGMGGEGPRFLGVFCFVFVLSFFGICFFVLFS